ncbi:MAG: peptidylprolyl isomerase [Thermoguttaceae bacterium]
MSLQRSRQRFFATLILAAVCSGLVAQEPAPMPPAVQPAAQSQNDLFETRFAAYRNVLKDLTAFKQEYPRATPQRQQEIEAAYAAKVQEGAAIHDALQQLAEAAWDEAPAQNPNVAHMLYSFVEHEFRRDNYEAAHRIFKKLLAAPIPDEARVLYIFAALSAINIMELDDAATWLQVAQKEGILEKYLAAADEKKRNTAEMLIGRLPQFRRDWEVEREIRNRETQAGETDPAQKLPRVEIETSQGKIVVELFENEAPNTVANFVNLVEKGFYDGTIFHRVLGEFMAQGGDPTGTGTGGPDYAIACECRKPGYRKHFRGTLSMAHAGPDTGGSQFFLTFVPTSFLDGKHTAFGRVVEGMPVLAKLQRLDPQAEDYDPSKADKIIKARVINKREHPYTPATLPKRR